MIHLLFENKSIYFDYLKEIYTFINILMVLRNICF